MEQLSPQLMHKLVFTVLMHGLNDAQTNLALKILTEALGHENPQIRELAVVALGDLPVTAARRVPALTIAAADVIPRVRRRAARALGEQGPAAETAVGVLVKGLSDPDPSVRRDCAGAIGRIGPAAHPAAAKLVSLLTEPETRSRAVAAVALKRIGAAAIPALLIGVRCGSADLRGRCATLLAQIAPDDPRVRAVVGEMLSGEDDEQSGEADVALEYVSTPPPMPTFRAIAPARA
jgi:HEAT repeat protein